MLAENFYDGRNVRAAEETALRLIHSVFETFATESTIAHVTSQVFGGCRASFGRSIHGGRSHKPLRVNVVAVVREKVRDERSECVHRHPTLVVGGSYRLIRGI